MITRELDEPDFILWQVAGERRAAAAMFTSEADGERKWLAYLWPGGPHLLPSRSAAIELVETTINQEQTNAKRT